ncbi:MAG TPA: hypothetical protein VMX58_09975, partial [Patescibacteria group bacterium]|nr:hypothetical protein [Patescibacteria group bacterium]
YQWGEDGLNDFIGVRYYVTNASMNYLNGVYIGIYADVDAGPREYGSYHMDDQVGSFEGIWCVQKDDAEIPVNLYVGYVYDNDGDNGRTPGYFGIAMLGYPVWIYYGSAKGYDYQWYLDPGTRSCRLSTFRIFRGLQPFEHGGEPTNDYERYEVLSSGRKDKNSTTANDYKILLSVGPFFLEPGQTQCVDFAFVCGEGLEDMLDHTASATLVYHGCFFDADENTETGIDGRETMIIGPFEDFMPDPCNMPTVVYDIAPKETAWTNRDCREEIWNWQYPDCYTPPGIDKSRYVTGVKGEETRLNWITGSAPPPPNIRLVPQDCAVTVLWDNFSETVRDPISLQYDFEGYQIWRADDWHRPYGTTTLSGPTASLWHMLAIRDLINGVSPNINFKYPFENGGWMYEPLADMPGKQQYINQFTQILQDAPLDRVPCPPELSDEVCDTIEALARFGLGFDGGKQYYKFVDSGVKNGLHYFYSVIAYDHVLSGGKPSTIGRFNSPASNFKYITPVSRAQEADEFEESNVYVVPNPVTTENVEPWRLSPNNSDPTGIKCEFHNLPRCRSTVRIYTISGDIVQVLLHDGSNGNGTQKWDLLSRNGQEVTSGVYLFSVDPEDGRFPRTVGKFVIIR